MSWRDERDVWEKSSYVQRELPWDYLAKATCVLFTCSLVVVNTKRKGQGGLSGTCMGPQFYGAVSKSFICTAFSGAGPFWWYVRFCFSTCHDGLFILFFFVRVFSLFSFKNQSMLCRYRQLCWLSTLFPAFHSGDLHVDCCLRKSFWHYLFFLLKFIIYEKHFVF